MPALLCFVMFVIAFICVVFEVVAFRKIYGNSCLIYISAFLMAMSSWSLTQVKLLPLMFGQGIYNSSMAYIMLSLIAGAMFLIVVFIRYKSKKMTEALMKLSILQTKRCMNVKHL